MAFRLDPDFPVARALPGRQEILGSLDSIVASAKAGDTVMFYYSGHGTVQPVNPEYAQDEPEADGNDQVILPADVGPYDIITHTIRNAIVDNELRARFDAIRAKGAFVWAVVDACHSGTVTRGEDVVRTVDPSVLNVPPATAVNATRGGGAHGAIELGPSSGGIAGFFAVEAYAEAIERPFTGYDPMMVGEGDKQRMGVFTYHLHRALLRNTATDFRELAQEIVADMNSDRSGGKVPPPVFDGDLDAAIFGAGGRRLPGAVTGILADGQLSLPGGILHGFDVGSRIDVYVPEAAQSPVAHAEIVEATAVTSRSGPLVWEKPADEMPSGSFSAVVSRAVPSFRFKVAPPPPSDLAGDAGKTIIDAAVGQLVSADAQALGVQLGQPGDPDADLILRVRNERLWILRPDRPWIETAGAYGETPSLALRQAPAALEAELRDAVWRLARAARLLRVAASPDPAGEDGEDLVVTAVLKRSPGLGSKTPCPKKPEPAGVSSPVSPLLPVAATHCDLVEVEVTNEGDRDYFVAGFYVDSLGGIAVVPRSAEKVGCVRTLPMGSDTPLRFGFWINTWDRAHDRPSSVGAENFVLLATPKDDSRQPPRLCALAQQTLSAMQKTRSAEMADTRGQLSPLQDLLGSVQGAATRGSNDYTEGASLQVTSRLFVFDVKP